MRILMVGDVVGRPGRRYFREITPKLRKEREIDVVIVNGENSAGGKGMTEKSLAELLSGGADVITSGNHIWDKKDVLGFIDREPFLIRPANYPGDAPGKGCCIFPYRAKNIGVMNLSGRSFMPPLDDPFQVVEDLLRAMRDDCDILLLDFHAETTSEKMAMAWYLDGRVNAVVGTHTHVQTADARILPKGTAFLTDLGMTGPRDSVLGVETEAILYKFTTGRPVRFEVADGPCIYNGVILTIDDSTNATTGIERIFLSEEA
ncbi:MAG: TIGR00282 family metallophosphoesterase [Selenomonadaceae bacterium]|nr:TIGR00282 family metallophosphoesterase [Selenomonadaceae bacterium]MDY2685662.1 TIGR00282 family metallophosphoesterase [Selenomonadaceae bacterium]